MSNCCVTNLKSDYSKKKGISTNNATSLSNLKLGFTFGGTICYLSNSNKCIHLRQQEIIIL